MTYNYRLPPMSPYSNYEFDKNDFLAYSSLHKYKEYSTISRNTDLQTALSKLEWQINTDFQKLGTTSDVLKTQR